MELLLNFDPFPLLETERLSLRQISVEDAPEIYELRSNPLIMQYIPRPIAVTIEDAIQNIENIQAFHQSKQGINWAITLKGNEKLIGVIGLYRIQPENLRCEIGYMLMSSQHNKGYVTEAIPTILSFAFENLNFHSVEAIIDPRNIASEKVLQKSGFVKEAHILENCFWNGEFLDTVIYSILSRNFKSIL